MSQLHDAVRNESIDDVKQAVLSPDIDINGVDNHKRTALHLAAWKNNTDILNILISFKANIHATAMDNFTAVHFAAQNANGSEFIKILIKNDKKLLDQRIKKDHKTALHLAVSKGNKDVARCLIELGADILAKTNNGRTPYDFVKNDDNEMKEILQKALDERNKKKTDSSKKKDTSDTSDTKTATGNNDNTNSSNSNNASIVVSSSLSQISNRIHINLDSDADDNDDDNVDSEVNDNSKRSRDLNDLDNNVKETNKSNINDNNNNSSTSSSNNNDNNDDNNNNNNNNEEHIVVKTGVAKKKRKIIMNHLENDEDD